MIQEEHKQEPIEKFIIFIKYQLEYLLKFNTIDIYFINILDGDNCYNSMEKFKFLLNKEKYNKINKYVFIGSLYEFQKKIFYLKLKEN